MEVRKACVVFGNPDLRRLILDHRARAIAHDVLLELIALEGVHSACKEILLTDFPEVQRMYNDRGRVGLYDAFNRTRIEIMYDHANAFAHQMKRIRNLQGVSFGILASAASCSAELGYPAMLRILRRQGPAERMLFERYREWVHQAHTQAKALVQDLEFIRQVEASAWARARHLTAR